MAKKRRKHMPRGAEPGSGKSATKSSSGTSANPDGVVTGPNYPTEEIKWWREAIEGLVVAIVLALLIRGFEAEAFVIPTGSMAPTLRGRHKDVKCEFCKFEYASGASLDNELKHGDVVMTSCPMCANPQMIDYDKSRDASFAGDRILVNKFSFDSMGEPERYDVIVFKNPTNAKQNYIKRLCGLPGETIRLFRGDIYAKPNDSDSDLFTICRKPPKKLRAMMQPVHDTRYLAKALQDAGLPPRWQPMSDSAAWTVNEGGKSFDLAASPNTNWLRYRHIASDMAAWLAIKSGEKPVFESTRGELISDLYAYNTSLYEDTRVTSSVTGKPVRDSSTHYWDRSTGKNWVGDIGVECNVQIKSNSGELVLDLVEGGWHFFCTFDVSTGEATLSMTDPTGQSRDLKSGPTVSTTTAIKGAGTYRILFTNIDSELRLWVNNSLVDFGQPTTYGRNHDEEFELRPYYGGPDDPGDLAPAGIGGKGLDAHVKRLRIHRDKYYVNVRGGGEDPTGGDYEGGVHFEDVRQLFRSPEQWATAELFGRMRGPGRKLPNGRHEREFLLEDFDDDSKDQFFPMGDNSVQSLDGRLWSNTKNYVERQFLIGEAVLIYYPHPWHAKLPGQKFRSIPLIFYPKVSRMGLIR